MKLVRALLAILLALGMILPLAACSQDTTLPTLTEDETEATVTEDVNEPAMPLTSYSIDELEGKIRYLGGRTGANLSGDVAFEWSGSGFEINALIGAEGSDLRVGLRSNYNALWRVFVDGEAFGNVIKTGSGNRKLIFARSIPAGEHEIRVVKDSQPATNKNNYNSFVSLELNGELLDPPAEKDLYLEFVGDGVLTGYGALGKKAKSSSINDETSFLSSVSYLTSSALDADYSVVARAGIGLITKAGAYMMEELYDHQYAYRDPDYYFRPTRTPDAIIFHVGMADSAETLTKGQFIVQAQDFIERVRSYYGKNIPIVWIYNTMYHTIRADEIQALPRVMGAGCNVYPLEGYYGTSGSGAGADRYPSAEEQQKTADILTAFLQEKLGL